MLERNFSQLDDDFITLWSNYDLYYNAMYHNDRIEIVKSFERLAEQGQINAIQMWYMLKSPEIKNEKINSIVDGYKGDEMNEAFAIAGKIYDRDRRSIDMIRDAVINSKWYQNEAIGTESYDELKRQFNKLKEAYRNTDYAQQMLKAGHIALDTAKQQPMSALYRLKIGEITKKYPLIYEQDFPGYKQSSSFAKSILNVDFKHNPERIDIKFAYAKCLRFFPSTPTEFLAGGMMLKELAQRPLHMDSQTPDEQAIEQN